MVAHHNTPPAYAEERRHNPIIRPILAPQTALGRAVATKQSVQIADVLEEPNYFDAPSGYTGTQLAKLAGARTILAVPMIKENELMGAIVIYRQEVRPFTNKQVELVTNFASQAVIAIENTRLFNEVQAKTRDLEEALTYQTGSANILNVIASTPTDVQPVLKAIVESACVLCEAYDAVVILKEGDELRLGAHHGPLPMSQQRWSNDRASISGRAMADRRPVQVHDLLSDEGADFAIAREMSRVDGCRTLLGAPLLREGEAIGAIVLRRAEAHPFSGKQIALLQTFADQAVIAINNAQLFEEVQGRTRDLEESLQQQTATADVLKVISRSAFDLQKVFNALTESACRVCGAYDAGLLVREAEFLRVRSHHGPIPMNFDGARISRDWVNGRSVVDRKSVHVRDLQAEAGEFPVGCQMATDGPPNDSRCALDA